VGSTYSQNAKTMDEYCDRLDQGHLPVVRGLALTRDDLIRRNVIMALMCQGSLLFESINASCLIDFKQYFANELEQLRAMQEQGLVEVTDQGIQVTPMGWFFVRGVAMVFDRYLQADRNRTRFSKII
jgi:oxygen-independent coproporphyrinogen-3 oxidase